MGDEIWRLKKKKRKLLVLDLNGLLVDIVEKAPDGYTPHIRIRNKSVFKRPFCDDFLKFCVDNFDVVIWTSRKKKNLDGLIDFVLGDLKHQVLQIWDQSQCTELPLNISQTGLQTKDNRCKPVFLKELKKLWDIYYSCLPWKKGPFNESNTLLLDDSPYKAILNPPHTAVFPISYSCQHENDNALGPGGDIRSYLEGIAVAENVQRYVEQHPFGQDCIAPSSQLHRKVINMAKCSKVTDHGGPFKPRQLSPAWGGTL